jgi:nucleotide sugar dehydrogenase
MHIGVIGFGFVGGALSDCFKEKGHRILIYDKYKNIGTLENTVKNSEIIFLCLPTLYNEKTKDYDLESLHSTCKYLNSVKYTGIIVIKSTILPNTSEKLSSLYNLPLIHNPEFLTASTAREDFENQHHIILGKSTMVNQVDIKKLYDFYRAMFPESDISICSSTESEIMKLTCNCFYATKIQFFNEIYELTNNHASYNKVIELCIMNGWINPMHTKVPGSDGKLSFGGLCFPKDTRALNSYMERKNINHAVLNAVVEEQIKMRNND